ncbi:MAG: hypothetical protein U1F36_15850 [Planctomycetota bacterium]
MNTSDFVVPLLLAAGLFAQDVKPPTLPGPAQIAAAWTSPCFDVRDDGTILAAGPGYRAAFGADGVRFEPVLGGDRAWPVEFRGLRASVAGHPLSLRTAKPIREGERVRIERGVLTESYEVGVDRIEQCFRFDKLDERGELLVSFDVVTDLVASESADGFHFRTDHGGVQYGRATAIDAGGRRLELESQLIDGRIRICVPETFVRAAKLPLLIDPVVQGQFTVTEASFQVLDPDVAWDTEHGQFLLVWSSVVSSVNFDVFSAQLSAEGAVVGGISAIEIDVTTWSGPKVAGIAGSGFLVVAEVHDSSLVHSIGGRKLTYGTSGLAWGPQLTIARSAVNGAPSGSFSHPDIGGDGEGGVNSHFAVVFEHTASGVADVYLRMTDPAGTPLGNALTPIGTSAFDESHPHISRSNGTGDPNSQTWAVVYQRKIGSVWNAPSRLWCALLDRNGQRRSLLGGLTWQVTDYAHTTDDNFDVSSPTDAVDGQRWILAVEARDNASSASYDIFGTLMTQQGISMPTVELTSLENPNAVRHARHQHRPVVDSDGARFAVAYLENYSTTDIDLLAATFAVVGNTLVCNEGNVPIATTTSMETMPALTSMLSGGGPRTRYLIAERQESGSTFRIRRSIYEGRTSTGGIAVRSTGCGWVGISCQGNPFLGGQLVFSATGNIQGGGFLIGSTVQQPIPGCVSCQLGTSNAIVLSTPSLPLQIPVVGGLVGASLSIQAFGLGGGSCIAGLGFSDTVDLVVQ